MRKPIIMLAAAALTVGLAGAGSFEARADTFSLGLGQDNWFLNFGYFDYPGGYYRYGPYPRYGAYPRHRAYRHREYYRPRPYAKERCYCGGRGHRRHCDCFRRRY